MLKSFVLYTNDVAICELTLIQSLAYTCLIDWLIDYTPLDSQLDVMAASKKKLDLEWIIAAFLKQTQ